MKIQQPLVSVIMPVHNGLPHLSKAVESIKDQSYQDWELIVVDDHSTDGSELFLAKEEDPRVSLIVNDQNLGIAKTLNKGLSIASGAFIARLDADDIALPTRLEIQIKYLIDNPEIGLLCQFESILIS